MRQSVFHAVPFRFVSFLYECEYTVIHVHGTVQGATSSYDYSKEYDTDTALVANERFKRTRRGRYNICICTNVQYGVLELELGMRVRACGRVGYLNKVASLFALAREKRVQFGDECILRATR